MNKIEECYHDLGGVLEDIDNSNGFDDVCKGTINRVHKTLGVMLNESSSVSACYNAAVPKDMLELIVRSDHEWLIDFLENKTVFDAERIRIILELGQAKAKEMLNLVSA